MSDISVSLRTNASGHDIRPYIHHIDIATNILSLVRQYKFHHITYVREACFAHQLKISLGELDAR